jgi:hypothetical protein
MIPLKLTQAGSIVTCTCGRQNQVPPMSELRQAVGQTPMPLTIVERIEQRLLQGRLPESRQCAETGISTESICEFHIVCEQPWANKGSLAERFALVFSLVFGFIGMFSAMSGSELGAEVHGRETTLTVPLRLDLERVGSIGRFSQRKLRELLSNEPLYAELLAEYPEAIISPR